MPEETYITNQGDMVDLIAYNYYGTTMSGQVEAILAANKALNLGQYLVLPAGLSITLPALATPTVEVIDFFS